MTAGVPIPKPANLATAAHSRRSRQLIDRGIVQMLRRILSEPIKQFPAHTCEEWQALNTWWLSGGAGHGEAARLLYDHLHSCAVCQAVAVMQREHVQAWIDAGGSLAEPEEWQIELAKILEREQNVERTTQNG